MCTTPTRYQVPYHTKIISVHRYGKPFSLVAPFVKDVLAKVFRFELYCPVRTVRTSPVGYRYTDSPAIDGTIETGVSPWGMRRCLLSPHGRLVPARGKEASPRLPAWENEASPRLGIVLEWVLGNPSRDSRSTVVLSLSEGVALVGSEARNALAQQRLKVILFFYLLCTTVDVIASTAEKRPSIGEEASLKKKKATPEQPADASGSTTRSPVEKGKEPMEIEEAPERGYTIRDLCEVEDRAGVDKYSASIMTRLKIVKG
ncbi:hypothetical protein BHM03_00022997 [Ensete ventricosum]|nr:hypothetical protein BHM03_00022997 [Ensete ventricosum]